MDKIIAMIIIVVVTVLLVAKKHGDDKLQKEVINEVQSMRQACEPCRCDSKAGRVVVPFVPEPAYPDNDGGLRGSYIGQ